MITFPCVVRAEWTKLAALRSTWIVLSTVIVLPALLQAALPDTAGRNLVRFVPVAAAQGMYAVGNPFRMLTPRPGRAGPTRLGAGRPDRRRRRALAARPVTGRPRWARSTTMDR